MKPVTLFVRSYARDFEWLKYSVQSMKKYLTGVETTVLVVPTTDRVPPEIAGYFDEIIHSFMYNTVYGYIAQQLDKLDAPRYVGTEYILYSDSDCIYTGPFNAQQMFKNDMPVLFMTPYSDLPPQGGHWREIVNKYLGFKPDYEFMRSFPLMHRTETILKMMQAYPKLTESAKGIISNEFSEFNMIGAYAYKYKHPYYFTEEIEQRNCKQFWSWGGMPTNIRKEVEALIA